MTPVMKKSVTLSDWLSPEVLTEEHSKIQKSRKGEKVVDWDATEIKMEKIGLKFGF